MTAQSIQGKLSSSTAWAALAAALLLSSCHNPFQAYRVSEDSMLPSFHPGDQFFADVKHITLADLHDGDVILLRHNDGIILKRILAMPGETISGADRRVYRNGKQLDEPYLAPATNDQTIAPITFAPRTIAAGELFVMGDNRDDSLDSRFPDYGPVRISDVVGKYNWTYSHALPDTKDR